MTAGQDQPKTMTGGTRGRQGRFERDINTAERDAEAARLRTRSWTYRQIAAELGISQTAAYEAVKRVLLETVQEPAEDLRKLEIDRLDEMAQVVTGVLEKHHVTVSNGKVVFLEGEPLTDNAPILAAVDRLLKIQERRARLLGLDIAVKQEIELSGVEYRVVGVMPEALR
jgi:predicted transcriptional regulator